MACYRARRLWADARQGSALSCLSLMEGGAGTSVTAGKLPDISQALRTVLSLLSQEELEDQLLESLEQDCERMEAYLEKRLSTFRAFQERQLGHQGAVEGVLEALEIYAEVLARIDEETQLLLTGLAEADELMRRHVTILEAA